MKHFVSTRRSDLNVRSGPGLGFRVIGSVAKGTTVDVVETRNGWGRLRQKGWASMRYLQRFGGQVIQGDTITIRGRAPSGQEGPDDETRPRRLITSRFQIRLEFLLSVAVLGRATFLIRDMTRRKQGRFRMDFLGRSVAPGNMTFRGGWTNVPDNSSIVGLSDFHRANAVLGGYDATRRGMGGGTIGDSRTYLRIVTRNHSVVNVRNLDTGSSLLPDLGAAAGTLTMWPPAEWSF